MTLLKKKKKKKKEIVCEQEYCMVKEEHRVYDLLV